MKKFWQPSKEDLESGHYIELRDIGWVVLGGIIVMSIFGLAFGCLIRC